jgi:putative endonuclease
MFITDTVYYLYIMSNDARGTLYCGMTSDLPGRVLEHRERLVPGFTQRYHLARLVWYEPHLDPADAAHRERLIKRWRRAWKIEMIERDNPTWADLYETVLREHGFE